jgi:hypothetical protein
VYLLVYADGADVARQFLSIFVAVFDVLHRVEEVKSPQRFDEPPASFGIDSFFLLLY